MQGWDPISVEWHRVGLADIFTMSHGDICVKSLLTGYPLDLLAISNPFAIMIHKWGVDALV